MLNVFVLPILVAICALVVKKLYDILPHRPRNDAARGITNVFPVLLDVITTFNSEPDDLLLRGR